MEFRELADMPAETVQAPKEPPAEALVEPDSPDILQEEVGDQVGVVQPLTEVLEDGEGSESAEVIVELVEPVGPVEPIESVSAPEPPKRSQVASRQVDAQVQPESGTEQMVTAGQEPPEGAGGLQETQAPTETLPLLYNEAPPLPAQDSGSGQEPPSADLLPPPDSGDDDGDPEEAPGEIEVLEADRAEIEPESGADEVPENEEVPPESTADLLNRLFEDIEAYNNLPRTTFKGYVQERIEAGANRREEDREAATTHQAMFMDYLDKRDREGQDAVNELEAAHQERLHEVGLALSPEAGEVAHVVIDDGERFAHTLAEVDEADLSDASRQNLEAVADHTLHMVAEWTLAHHEETMRARYDIPSDTNLLYRPRVADSLRQVQVMDEALSRLEVYTPELRRLNLAEKEVEMLEVMKAAHQDGMLIEASLLYETGVLQTDFTIYLESDAAYWAAEPAEWQLLDRIVDHIVAPGRPTAFRAHMAHHIPDLLDRRHDQALATRDAPDDGLDIPQHDANEAAAAFFARKRDEYRARLRTVAL